jgi:hypothetical protein
LSSSIFFIRSFFIPFFLIFYVQFIFLLLSSSCCYFAFMSFILSL